ncbi:MAG: hypothetical protein A3K76_06615 [Euryarchaeota archaeon RBG_13_57_23]|nr:MAG: hypothetical protein A3K76_06615 [Euryarchaeota archaeon RBG_13_57_23]
MAKKLRKVTTPPRLLLVELLVPWIVMGLAALLGLYLGFGEIAITVFALASALTTTVIVRFYEQRRRRILARNLKT